MIKPGFVALLIIAACTCSCALFRGKAPPSPPVITAPPASRQEKKEPPQLPPPPKVDTPPSSQVPNPPVAAERTPPQMPKPPKVQPPKPRRRKQPVAAKPLPSESEPPPAPQAPAAPPPQLTQMLSPAEQAGYNRSIDAALRRTGASLARVGGRPLNPAQQAHLERIHAFVREAQSARVTDLVTAKSFADRADLLAQDLVKSLRP